MTNTAIAILGLATGFASAVWLLLAVSHLHHRRYWLAVASVLLLAANLVSTASLYIRLTGSTYRLPASASSAILLALIFLPALLQLLPWLAAKRLLRR